jgi:peptide/nickel transport system substrate-binding protein
MMDFDERQHVVFAAQQEAYDEIPGVVLAYPNTVQAYRNDRFEGWVPHPGEDGYILPSYNHDSFLSLTPVTAGSGDTSSDGGGMAGWAIGAAIAAGVVAIVVVMARGRSRRISEEEA